MGLEQKALPRRAEAQQFRKENLRLHRIHLDHGLVRGCPTSPGAASRVELGCDRQTAELLFRPGVRVKMIS